MNGRINNAHAPETSNAVRLLPTRLGRGTNETRAKEAKVGVERIEKETREELFGEQAR
jgi:hypothetical protein